MAPDGLPSGPFRAHTEPGNPSVRRARQRSMVMMRSIKRWQSAAAGVLTLGSLLAISASAVAADATRPVTFSKDVAPIFQAKCQECHQPGSIAPMSLLTYQDARPWARSIKERVTTRQMPPWHIDKTVGVQQFKNDMSLTDEQVNTIVAWVDAGAPQGNPKDLPTPKSITT